MLISNYTVEDLKKLPLRGITAFAVRCARRVEHLTVLPEDHPERERLHSAVARAIEMAEDFVRGLPCPTCKSVVRDIEASHNAAQGEPSRDRALGAIIQAAHTAATALHVLNLQTEPPQKHFFAAPRTPALLARVADITADMTALVALTAAVEAASAFGYADRFIDGSTDDYAKLLRLGLGSYPQADTPIDPSPAGPLGSLGRVEDHWARCG